MALGSCDLSKAEKKLTVAKGEQILKMTTLFAQNYNFWPFFEWKLFSFCEFAQVWQQLLSTQLVINHMIQEPTTWTDVEHLKQ